MAAAQVSRLPSNYKETAAGPQSSMGPGSLRLTVQDGAHLPANLYREACGEDPEGPVTRNQHSQLMCTSL